jgi:hypothetical protein
VWWPGAAFLLEKKVDVKNEIKDLKKRVGALERLTNTEPHGGGIIEAALTLPKADIAGLHFNKTKVLAVFERHEDGAYYSRDILFNSARDTDDGTGRDLLSEYLDSRAVRKAFQKALGKEVRVFLPEESRGVKNYNSVRWWYWLRRPASGFFYVSTGGSTADTHAGSVGGCAPAFRFQEDAEAE